MITAEENDYLTQVAEGTAMGTLLRRYWLPVLLETEVPGSNAPPKSVKVLDQDFVVWRDAEGKIGFFDRYCPHRRVSLSLGRCEGDGLRCIFHGWKFATDGRVLEAPNQRSEEFVSKLKGPVFPSRVAGGMLWVYIGPPELEPPFPDYPFMRLSAHQRYVSRTEWNVNFVQGIESNLDSSHIGILHNQYALFGERRERVEEDDELRDVIVWDDDAPVIVTQDHECGFHVAAIRDVTINGNEKKYARVHSHIVPVTNAIPAPIMAIHVPIDRENSSFFTVLWDKEGVNFPLIRRLNEYPESMAEKLSTDVVRYTGTVDNNWLQDRQKMHEEFSGFPSVAIEDLAVLSSMGPISERHKEGVGGSDAGVNRMRRMLIDTARALENGIEPPHPSESRIRN